MSKAQDKIDACQGTDTKCPWHLVEYTRKDIGGGLTIKVCEPCAKHAPKHPYAQGAGKRVG